MESHLLNKNNIITRRAIAHRDGEKKDNLSNQLFQMPARQNFFPDIGTAISSQNLGWTGPLERKKDKNADNLPYDIQMKMESTFNEDFSNVTIHQNSYEASALNALAYTQVEEIYFAPGHFNTESSKGQELIGHEIAHVVQQREGRVHATSNVNGKPINDDRNLEKEADAMGKKSSENSGTYTNHSPGFSFATSSFIPQLKCEECEKKTEMLNMQEEKEPFQLKSSDAIQFKSWYDHFKECMDGVGLPSPTSLFTTATTAVATIAALEKAVATFGTEVTIGELIGAGVLSEFLIAAAAVTASFYVGACIGCAAIATGESL